MKYFVENSGRKGTCYHEFYKGKWDGATFRKDDSVFLHDDTLDQCGGLVEALMLIIPSYDRYGPTEVFAADWEKIGKAIRHSDYTRKPPSGRRRFSKRRNASPFWEYDKYKKCTRMI